MPDIKFEHGGNIYEARRRPGENILDFSASINPLGLPPYVKGLISGNLKSILHYPDPEAVDLTGKIARHWGISRENVLAGNGSIELIYLIVTALKPKTALITAPDFSEYERALRCAGVRPDFLKLASSGGFRLDTARVTPSDIFFFSNPNNPTGNFIADKEIKIDALPAGTVVVDEAFMDFAAHESAHTMIHRAVRSEKVIVLRTFTKFFALPGLRAGYLVANKDIVRSLKSHQAPWSVNVLAQMVSARMLGDRAYYDNTRFLVKSQRNYLSGALSRIDALKVFPSAVNYILVRIEKRGLASRRLREELLKKGIMVRDCGNFRGLGRRFIRVAVRTRHENTILVRALKDILR
ncbi:MAG: threonine-phosphate decarboxylase [Candidatus Omnitrophica bacterium]|nr:threonine-phosphate decarboxylase [Candidatus Omnitrophota bacterium]